MRLRQSLALLPLLVCLAAPEAARAQVTNYAIVPSATETPIQFFDIAAWVAMPGTPPTGAVNSHYVATTPDGRLAFVSSNNGSLFIVDVATRTLVSTIPLMGAPHAIAVTPDGRSLFIADRTAGTVVVMDIATTGLIGGVSGCTSPSGLVVSPDGQKAYVACEGANTVLPIFMSEDGASAGSPISVGASPFGLALTPDGARLFVTNTADWNVSVIDTGSDTVTTTLGGFNQPYGVTVSPDGLTAYVANQGTNGIIPIDVATLTVGPMFLGYGINTRGLAVTPDGTQIIAVHNLSGTIRTLSTTTQLPTMPEIFTSDSPTALGAFLTPNIIVPGNGPYEVETNAELHAKGFGRFVPFNGGTMRLLGDLNVDTLSLLAGGGTIDTDGRTLTAVGTINAGLLRKNGQGTLRLTGTVGHTGGTELDGGRLEIPGDHLESMLVKSGTLAIGGNLGALVVQGGFVELASGAAVETAAASVQISNLAVLTLSVSTNGSSLFCDRLRSATPVQVTGGALGLNFQGTLDAAPIGASCTLVAGGTVGQFMNIQEGMTSSVGSNRRLQYTYAGGVSQTDLVATVILDASPVIGAIADQTVIENVTLGPLDFSLADDYLDPAHLTVTASSSNQALLPNSAIVLGGAGATRTIMATPLTGATGETTITIHVADIPNGNSSTRSFRLTVQPFTRSYFLAEGATGAFFDTDILIANPNGAPAPVTLRFTTEGGGLVTRDITVGPFARRTVRVDELSELAATTFTTEVVSTEGSPLAVERTMWWDATGYGAHTEKASDGPAPVWHFAEGAQGFFATYYLLANPVNEPNEAHITWYREDGVTVTRDYPLPLAGRRTVDAGTVPELATQAFSARITFDRPGMAERAMYFGGQPAFSGGGAASGVTEPATSWFFAEGATGSFFSTYLLIANPNDQMATVDVSYLRDNGGVIATKRHEIGPRQRHTIDAAGEAPELLAATFSARMVSDRPIIAERSIYWPRPAWYESHNSAGVTSPSHGWALAEGRVGGASGAQTFILLANPNDEPAVVTVRFLREAEGAEELTKEFTLPAQSRRTFAIAGEGSDAPELVNESFGARIDATRPIIVERSLYTNANGVLWIAGTNATGTPLQIVQ